MALFSASRLRGVTRWCALAAAAAALRWGALWLFEGYLPEAAVALSWFAVAGLVLPTPVLAMVALPAPRWRARLLPAGLAVAAGWLVVAAARLPDESALRFRYRTHRGAFARLGAMLAEDMGRRPPGHRAPNVFRDAGTSGGSLAPLPFARAQAYRAVLAQAGLPEGVLPGTWLTARAPAELDGVALVPVFADGFLGHYAQRGYAYAPGPAAAVLAAWFRAHQPGCPPLALAPVDGAWYVYRFVGCHSPRDA